MFISKSILDECVNQIFDKPDIDTEIKIFWIIGTIDIVGEINKKLKKDSKK